jgi:hypothetical protein
VEVGTVVEESDGVVDEPDGTVGTITSAKATALPKNKEQPRLLNNKNLSDGNDINITSAKNWWIVDIPIDAEYMFLIH